MILIWSGTKHRVVLSLPWADIIPLAFLILVDISYSHMSRFKSSTVFPTHIPSPGVWNHLLLTSPFPCKITIYLGEWPYIGHLSYQSYSFLIFKESWFQKLASPGPESYFDSSSFIQKKLSSGFQFFYSEWLSLVEGTLGIPDTFLPNGAPEQVESLHTSEVILQSKHPHQGLATLESSGSASAPQRARKWWYSTQNMALLWLSWGILSDATFAPGYTLLQSPEQCSELNPSFDVGEQRCVEGGKKNVGRRAAKLSFNNILLFGPGWSPKISALRILVYKTRRQG